MANTASAKKRVRSNARKAVNNRHMVSRVRGAVRAAREGLEGADAAAAKTATMQALSMLDKAAGKGVLHKNNAARRKGRLMKQLAALEAKK
ncbi:MAG: 30S ribosomal protein S20 [Chloroflexi bacterium]|nr:30S ribosomal protein S20 [Chloroflexota bacterium]MBI3177956.1 30S ribosomal protein S20 [Chloroflexota bacterium]MBI4315094.1 30S ribosomal protein S20 [Chloroflexota bacterium]MBI5829827.1 30S ribosomal protein S20 [Chloroflexota bacterium]